MSVNNNNLHITKTIRGAQVLKFIHYIHGLDYVASKQSMFCDLYKYKLSLMYDPEHGDKNNPYHTKEFYNNGKNALVSDQELKLSSNSSYHDITSAIHLVHEQAEVLSFISDHVLGIIVSNIKKKNYLKSSEEANKKYNKLLLASSIYSKFKNYKPQIERKKFEELNRIEKTFTDDYFTGKNILSIAEDLAVYIEVLIKHNRGKINFNSDNYNALMKLKLSMYVEIFLDLISAFQITESLLSRHVSATVMEYMKEAQSKYKHIDFLTRMYEIEKEKKKSLNRLYEVTAMSELWLEKIRKHAPLPDAINIFNYSDWEEE